MLHLLALGLELQPDLHGVTGDIKRSAHGDEVVEAGVDYLALDDVLGADPTELEGDQSAQQAGEIIGIILEAGHCCVSSFSLVAASASHHSINARKMGLVLPWSAQPAKPIQPLALKLMHSRRSK